MPLDSLRERPLPLPPLELRALVEGAPARRVGEAVVRGGDRRHRLQSSDNLAQPRSISGQLGETAAITSVEPPARSGWSRRLSWR